MRHLKNVLVMLLILWTSAAFSLDIDSKDYAVYEKNGDLYVVPKDQLLILHGTIATPISYAPNLPGYKILAGFLDTLEPTTLSARDLANDSSYTLTNYILTHADLNRDGHNDLLIQGANNNLSLAIVDNGTADVYFNVDGDLYQELFSDDAQAYTPASGFPVGNVVGAMAGSFRVDESGQANYTVPIYTPQGSAGVAPQLSLNYNSQAGNGLVGKGWSMGGLSAITRCRQTLHQDNNVEEISWGASDRFCIDGQRLILETGTYGAPNSEYRTEISNYAKITAKGGSTGSPDYFQVEAKDGSTTTYGASGSTTTSEQEARNSGVETGKVLNWAISEFKDSANNKIKFEYFNEEAGHRIKHINYAYGSGTSANAQIEFTYMVRTDDIYGYVGGYKFKSERLLKRITVKNNEEKVAGGLLTVREYLLHYSPSSAIQVFSQLNSITECRGADCFEPTQFTWLESAGGYSTTAETTTLESQSDRIAIHRQGDVNGDGFMDIIWQEPDYDNDGKVHDQYWKYALYDSATGKYGTPSQFYWTSANPNSSYTWDVLDYNQDGYTDVMIPYNGFWRIYLSTGSGYSGYITTAIPTGNHDEIQLADLNSDGLADLIYESGNQFYVRYKERYLTSGQWQYQFSASSVALSALLPSSEHSLNSDEPIVIADFNGDGLMDIIAHHIELSTSGGNSCLFPPVPPIGCIPANKSLVVLTSKSDNSFEEYKKFSLLLTTTKNIRTGDFNGDGLPDLLIQQGNDWKAYLNTGSGFKYIQNLGNLPNDKRISLTDYNQDGRADVVFPDAGKLYFRLFNAATEQFAAAEYSSYTVNIPEGAPPFIPPGVYTIGTVSITNSEQDQYYMADIDGDGTSDYVNLNLGTGQLKIQKGLAVKPYITAINNGLGNKTDIDYEPLTNSAVYTRSTDANDEDWDLPSGTQTLGKTAPVFDLLPSGAQVVASVKSTAPRAADNAPGQVNYAAQSELSYQYSGAKVQAGGRGLLGFQTVRSIDPQSNIWTTTHYRQDFPFIGHPLKTERLKHNGGTSWTLLSTATTSWAFQNWGSGHSQAPYRTYRYADYETSYGLTGAEVSHQVNTNAVDEWGNILTTTSSSYPANNHSSWLSQVVTSNSYSAAGFTGNYSQEKGRLSSTTVTHKRSGVANIVRNSSFTYHTSGNQKGLLKDEIIEPGNSNQLTTTHSYDSMGNRIKTTIKGDDGTGVDQTRYTRWVYDSYGRQVDHTIVWNGNTDLPIPAGVNGVAGEVQTSEVADRNEYGAATVINGLNGLVSYIEYDNMGREYFRGNNTGAWTTTTHSDSGLITGAQQKVVTNVAGGGSSSEYFDALGRSIAKRQTGFSGSNIWTYTEYDSSGRVKRQSTPHYLSGTAYWSTNSYDSLGRPTQQTAPDGTVTTVSYNGLSTTTTVAANSLSQIKTEEKDATGVLIKVTDNIGGSVGYNYTATGNLWKTHNKNSILSKTITTEISYDIFGRKKNARPG